MTQAESRIKREIRAAISERGAFWSLVPEGTFAKPGDPDMVVCYKGRYIGMEGKTSSGRLSEIQKMRRDQIEAAGGIYAVVRSVEDAMTVLDKIDKEGEI